MARLRVLVGVDGSRAARYAVLWAAQEARIRRSDLVIIHIDPPSADRTGVNAEATGGEAILEASAAAARHQEPSITVDAQLLQGPIAEALIKLSNSATMLVVGVDPSKPRAAHGLIGPIEDRVVVHALCPVVTVHGPARSVRDAHPDVVVGWKDDDSAPRTLDMAAAEAHVRGASLTVVSVIADDDHQLDHSSTKPEPHQALTDAVAVIERNHPALHVRVTQQEADVVLTLRHHAHSAELLVIGCPQAKDRWSIRTGQVAGALMREAPCPVMLVGRLNSPNGSGTE